MGQDHFRQILEFKCVNEMLKFQDLSEFFRTVSFFSRFFRNCRRFRRSVVALSGYTLTINICVCCLLSAGAETNLAPNASFPYFLKMHWGRVLGRNNSLSKLHIGKIKSDKVHDSCQSHTEKTVEGLQKIISSSLTQNMTMVKERSRKFIVYYS